MLRNAFFAAAAALGLLSAAPAAAALLVIDNTTSKVTGATGVVVNGTTYDVTFQDGTCAALFGGCDAGGDFNFSTQVTAEAAAQALLTQVILANLNLDASPGTMRGCSEQWVCDAYIPFQLNGTRVSFAAVSNAGDSSMTDSVYVGNLGNGSVTFNTSSNAVGTYAVFRASTAAVPEPATWAMMLMGFGGIAMAMRRRKLVPFTEAAVIKSAWETTV